MEPWMSYFTGQKVLTLHGENHHNDQLSLVNIFFPLATSAVSFANLKKPDAWEADSLFFPLQRLQRRRHSLNKYHRFRNK